MRPATCCFSSLPSLFTWRLYYGLLEMRELPPSRIAVVFAFLPLVDHPVRTLVCMIVLIFAILHTCCSRTWPTRRARSVGRTTRSSEENDDERPWPLAALGFRGALFLLIALRGTDRRRHDRRRDGRLRLDRRHRNRFLSFLKTEMYWRFSSFDFSVIPLFSDDGQFRQPRRCHHGLVFAPPGAFIGHFPRAGFAMGGDRADAPPFGTISGSSLANRRHDGSGLAAGIAQVQVFAVLRHPARLAAGGTLGRADPAVDSRSSSTPSWWKETSSSCFQAAFIPGILAAIGLT